MKKRYPRTTKLDFLERCSQRTAGFFRYWQSKRRGEALPGRGDLDPIEMKDWLPGLVLVDVAPDPTRTPPYRLAYRLVGTRSNALRDLEATGRNVEEAFAGNDLAEVLENYRLVIEQRTPVYDWDHTVSQQSMAQESGTLLLPLAGDGATVDMVICYQEISRL